MAPPKPPAVAKPPIALTAAELQAHPEFPHCFWKLPTSQQGLAPVAKTRGGPINLSYEVHGTGPTRIVWIMGLGGLKGAWQRQSKEFGHVQGDGKRFSSLVFDNRGIGGSDKPLMRYSTSEMARDTLDLADYLGWTGARELHVVGISMGGMIAQELAYLAPERVASLSLISTANQLRNTVGFVENLRNRINLFLPKSIDVQLSYAKTLMYPADFLTSPDNDVTPVVQSFPTQGDRFAAGELTKRLDPNTLPRKGFIAQAIAAGWHNKTPQQLGQLAEKVGRDRICVLHGTEDKMISFVHGEWLADGLDTGKKPDEKGVRRYWIKDVGHVAPIQRREEFNRLINEQITKAEKLR